MFKLKLSSLPVIVTQWLIRNSTILLGQ